MKMLGKLLCKCGVHAWRDVRYIEKATMRTELAFTVDQATWQKECVRCRRTKGTAA